MVWDSSRIRAFQTFGLVLTEGRFLARLALAASYSSTSTSPAGLVCSSTHSTSPLTRQEDFVMDRVAHLLDGVDAGVVGDGVDELRVGLSLGLPLAVVSVSGVSDGGRQGVDRVLALGSRHVLADVLNQDVVARVPALGDRLGLAGLALHLLNLGDTGGGVVGERVVGEELRVCLGGRQGHGSGGQEGELEHGKLDARVCHDG